MADKCPKCGCPNITSERRIDGFTECRGCGFRAKHNEFWSWVNHENLQKAELADLRRQLATAERDILAGKLEKVREAGELYDRAASAPTQDDQERMVQAADDMISEVLSDLPPAPRPTCEESVASCLAHRACTGTEHDPLNGKLHGCCVVCGIPWPCDTAKHFLITTTKEAGDE